MEFVTTGLSEFSALAGAEERDFSLKLPATIGARTLTNPYRAGRNFTNPYHS